jgi:hypothetical protein
MTAPLVPCHACARHLFADASRCPFCDVPREPQALAYAPVPRMSRAALAALGAALAVVPAAALVAHSGDADAQSAHRSGASQRSPRADAGVAATDAGAASDAAAQHDAQPHRRPPPIEHLPVPLYGVSPKASE